MNYLIVGTAGHIDHGKSSLIKALSGFWGDTTDEEKRRGITIDLSFSYLKSPTKTLAFIDVPGHENLVGTMISGAYGFDIALVAIDINEGIKPQTKEHLEVLNFLHVKQVVLALTKVDLASDEIIEKNKKVILDEVATFSNLNIADVCLVSIYDENSITALRHSLLNLTSIKRDDRGVFRYYIDRIFHIKGLGVVVTGTVLEGSVEVGQKVWVSELSKELKVKNIQIHEAQATHATLYQRAALLLANISSDELEKGMLLTQKGYIRGFKKIDLFLKVLPKKNLPHNAKITLHVGSLKINGTLLHVKPNEQFSEGFSHFLGQKEMFFVYNDKCIVTYEGEVVAGGEVMSGIYDPIKKRFKPFLLEALKKKNFSKAFEILVHIHKKGFGLISAYQRFGLSHEEALQRAYKLQDVFIDEKALIVYPKGAMQSVKEMILKVYEKNPYALTSSSSLSLKHKWISQSLAMYILENLENEEKIIKRDGVYIKQGINFDELTNKVEEGIYQAIKNAKTAPLAPYNIYDQLQVDRKTGDNALKKLTKSKKVVRLSHNLFVSFEALSQTMEHFRALIQEHGFIDIQTLKAHYALSRKYLIAYIEYLDKFDDIKKDGVKRVFK